MENTNFFKRFLRSKTAPLLGITILIILFFYIMNPNFLSLVNLRVIMSTMSLSGIVTVGVACLQIGGGTNLAAGWEGMFAGQLCAFLLSRDFLGWTSWPAALAVVLLFGAVCGAISAYFVNGLGFMGFIVTSATGMIWRGLGQSVTDNQVAAIANPSFWKFAGGSILKGNIPMPFIYMVVLLVVYGFMLSRTQFGRNIYLVGGNKAAARLAGIKPKAVSTFLHINSSVISAFGGFTMASKMHQGNPTAFQGLETDAITACVLGGISFAGGSGGMFSCFVGLLMINAFSNGLIAINFDPYLNIISKGLLLIAALAFDTLSTRAMTRSALKAAQKAALAAEKA